MVSTGSQDADLGVAVVTDTTAYLPDELVAQYGITVVPLRVAIAGKYFDEGSAAPADMVADALRRHIPISTSRPNPQVFATTYQRLADQASAVVAIHLCSEMSGTYEAAMLAAREASLPVRVVDSRSLGMGLGFAVLDAAAMALAGAGPDEVVAAAQHRMARTSVFFYVDTLEYLHRGGRIGAAATVLGSAFAIKPLLHLVDGRIELLEKVRTASRAIDRLTAIAVARAGETDVDIAVHHLAHASQAENLASQLRTRISWVDQVYVREVGAVVGAHVGPGMLAVVVSPHSEATRH